MESEIARRADAAREETVRAGRLTWEYFERGVPADRKADATPVTAADRDAEQLLRETLGRHFPDDGFLGEEHGEQTGTSGYKWIIDPVDATKNFIRGIPFFATLVGLEHEGEMAAGFVHVPALRRLYHAVKGCGAFRDDRAIKVSNVGRLEDAQLVYSSIHWFDKTGTYSQFLRLVRSVGRCRGFGDFLGYLLVADGAVEVTVEPHINPWDIAAMKPIVEEAGGVLTDWYGKDTVYGTGCVAGNPTIHRRALEILHAKPPSSMAET